MDNVPTPLLRPLEFGLRPRRLFGSEWVCVLTLTSCPVLGFLLPHENPTLPSSPTIPSRVKVSKMVRLWTRIKYVHIWTLTRKRETEKKEFGLKDNFNGFVEIFYENKHLREFRSGLKRQLSITTYSPV